MTEFKRLMEILDHFPHSEAIREVVFSIGKIEDKLTTLENKIQPKSKELGNTGAF